MPNVGTKLSGRSATAVNPAGLVAGGGIALASAIGFGRFVYTPVLPAMVEGLQLTTSQAGLIASANYFGYLLGAVVSSASGHWGSRWIWLVVSLFVSAVTTGAMGLTSEIGVFLSLRFVGGLASAFVLVYVSAIILDGLAELRQPKLSTAHFAGVGLGIAASALLVSWLAAEGFDWRVAWFVSGGLSLIAAVMVAKLVPSGLGSTRDKTPHIKTLIRPGLRSLIVAYGLFGFGYVITATFLVAIVRKSPEIQALEPMIWLIVGLSGAPSILFWTWLAGRIGVRRGFALACLIEGIGVALSVTSTSIAGVITSAVFLGGTFMGITALGLVEARRLSDGDPRRALAYMTAAFGVGQIVGPIFAGVVFDRTGSFATPSLAAAGLLVVAAILTLRETPRYPE